MIVRQMVIAKRRRLPKRSVAAHRAVQKPDPDEYDQGTKNGSFITCAKKVGRPTKNWAIANWS